MGDTFLSLLCIVVVGFAAPLISWVVPRRIVPETVLLIFGGLLIGPAMLGMAHETVPIEFLRELGLAFLFLMAGYEIDVNELRGGGGRHAMIAWSWSLMFAFAVVGIVGVSGGVLSANGIAIAIAMTSTAIGTILPILRERGLLQTAVGAAILNHGAVGEVAPIILMALLLGSRATWKSLLILLGFLAITLLIVRFTDQVRRGGQRLVEAIHLGGSTTAQTTVRLTVLLLVGLCTLAEMFELDVVLGAFAAGFILRYAVPGGSRELEEKLDGLAYGFFVPIFFVTSGMAIELEVSGQSLRYLAAFLVALVVVRGVPVWLASRLERRRDGTRAYSMRQSLQIAVYSTTALPIIVAVTQAAVAGGAMSSSVASTLVLAGAASVLLMPALGLGLQAKADAQPVTEALAVPQGPRDEAGHEVKSAGEPLTAAEAAHLAQEAGLVGSQADAVGLASGASGDEIYVSEPRKPAGLGAASAASPASAGEADAAGPGALEGAEAGRRFPVAGKVFGFAGHSLSDAEARFVAQRLAQIEADRMQWRAAMLRQRGPWHGGDGGAGGVGEGGSQGGWSSRDWASMLERRNFFREAVRERRREERAQVHQIRDEVAQMRRAGSASGSGKPGAQGSAAVGGKGSAQGSTKAGGAAPRGAAEKMRQWRGRINRRGSK